MASQPDQPRRVLTREDLWGPDEDEQILPRADRLPILRRLLPETRGDICRRRPELWPDDRTGHRRLEKDLKALGAAFAGGVWSMPAPAGPPQPDHRLVDLERLERLRRDVSRQRSPLWTDAAALVANLEALVAPGPDHWRPVGARLLAEWLTREALGVRAAARRLGVLHAHVRLWLRGRRPRGWHRRTLESVAGIPAASWDCRERVDTPKVSTPEDA